MKIEKILMYAIPIAIGGMIVYYLVQQQQAPATQQVMPPAQANGYPIPTYTGELSTGAVDARSTLLAMASQQLGLPTSELVVRGLRPEDLGLTTSWSFTSTVANTWETWINTNVADNRFIAIEGVSYGGTSFNQIQIQPAASTGAYWNLSFVAGLVSQLWYSAVPVIVQQNQPIVVQVISNAVATESINLIGTVCERRGLLINP